MAPKSNICVSIVGYDWLYVDSLYLPSSRLAPGLRLASVRWSLCVQLLWTAQLDIVQLWLSRGASCMICQEILV